MIEKVNTGIALGLITPRPGEIPAANFRCTSCDEMWQAHRMVDSCPSCHREIPAYSTVPGMTFVQCLEVRLNEMRRRHRGRKP